MYCLSVRLSVCQYIHTYIVNITVTVVFINGKRGEADDMRQSFITGEPSKRVSCRCVMTVLSLLGSSNRFLVSNITVTHGLQPHIKKTASHFSGSSLRYQPSSKDDECVFPLKSITNVLGLFCIGIWWRSRRHSCVHNRVRQVLSLCKCPYLVPSTYRNVLHVL